MTALLMADTSVEVEIEELKAQKSALDKLKTFNIDVAHVYRAWDHEISDRTMMVQGCRQPVECIIFVDSKDRPRTALILGDTVVVQVGWLGEGESDAS